MKITIDNIKDMVNSTLKILFEGVDYSFNNDTGSVDFSINQDKTDKGNISGGLSVDTRVFGTKDDILNGHLSMKDILVNESVNTSCFGSVVVKSNGDVVCRDQTLGNIKSFDLIYLISVR